MEKEDLIVPTRDEKKVWKQNLYEVLHFLSTERPEFYPRKKDSLATLLEAFLSWANTYNEGYFIEREDADHDRYSAWLVQSYNELYC